MKPLRVKNKAQEFEAISFTAPCNVKAEQPGAISHAVIYGELTQVNDGAEPMFRVINADFSKGQQIGEVDMSAYRGQAGDAIRITLETENPLCVSVSMSDDQSQTLEQGEAIRDDQGVWRFEASQSLDLKRPLRVEVQVMQRLPRENTANYNEHDIYYSTDAFSPCGTYFNDGVTIFLRRQWGTPPIQRYDIFAKHTRLVNGQVEVVDNRTVVELEANPSFSMACCTHKGRQFVFWTQNDGAVHYASRGNEPAWGGRQRIAGFKVNFYAEFSAVSVGERLYIFTSHESRLVVAWSDDGVSWSSEVRQDWINVHHLRACNFTSTRGEPTVMIAVKTTNNNLWTGRYAFIAGQGGSGLSSRGTEEHTELRGQGRTVALVAGSAQGGANGLIVQMFVNGRWDAFGRTTQNNQKKEFDVAAGRWHGLTERDHGWTRHPTRTSMDACQYFTGGEKETRQEVWNLMCYPGYFGNYLYVVRWNSDLLQLVETREEPVPDEFRNLIGVVEGPPPYALNDSSFRPTVSRFSFDASHGREGSVTTSYSFGMHLNIGGKIGDASLGMGIAAKHAQGFKETHSVTTSIKKLIEPLVNISNATRIFLRPVVIRMTYQLSDWNGVQVPNAKMYIFSSSQAGYDFEEVSMNDYPGSPDTHRLDSWYRRFTKVPDYVDPDSARHVNVPVVWTRSGATEWSFREQRRTLKTTKHEVSGKVNIGAPNIFDIGGNTSFTYQTDSSTIFSSAVSLRLDYPKPNENEDDHIRKLTLRVWLFTPREDRLEDCYWIPENLRQHRPWLQAWSVDAIERIGDAEAQPDQEPELVGNNVQ